ncbi:hypothetical protein K435DRAFT_60783 [Dendrothele bispora CBS 962.96]|uniref:GmrSD restriction endonucleases N-terminal domain-containing protein n=1 Tax=Dendrothele bispora (strain CBS 962.96) TaxID=1314807 RepID=A0A4S8M6X0_DENBC|nr:hypothetical protein K435DRAFT_60783 [Dendrothele bispora CBS 962.96]
MAHMEYHDLSSEDELGLADAQNRSTGVTAQVRFANTNESHNEYRLQKALRPPRATTYTAQALYEQICSRDINLEPEYQRGRFPFALAFDSVFNYMSIPDVVWTESKQIGLIDSILRNFYIPPIIFAVNAYDDGSETKTCIDGKQRLTSLFKFMAGEIPHRDPITNEKFWYRIDPATHSNARARTPRLLPEKYRRSFANKQIVCVEYQELTDENERDIFQRVQLGMALTPAEKLHVINTPRANFIRSLLTSFVEKGGALGDPQVMPWDRSRGSDFRCIAQGVFVMYKWGTGTLTGSGSLPQVERWLTERGNDDADTGRAKKRGPGRPLKKGRAVKRSRRSEDLDDMDVDQEDQIQDDEDDGDYLDAPQVTEAFARKVRETYTILAHLATTNGLNEAFRPSLYQKVSPIEMICIPVLIYAHGVYPGTNDRLSLHELASAITEMRANVRSQHKDIRMNDRVGKSMIEFIRSIQKAPPEPSLALRTPASFPGGDRQIIHLTRTTGDSRAPVSVSTTRSPQSSTTRTRASHADNKAPTWATLPQDSSPARHPPPNPQRLPSPEPTAAIQIDLGRRRFSSQNQK